MNRLTHRDKRGKLYISKYDETDILYVAMPTKFTRKQDFTNQQLHDRFVSFGNVAIALAAYEDTGLSPEEITRLTAENEALKKEQNAMANWIQEYTESIDQPCVACKHYTGDNICKPICGGCGRMGSESCKWQWRGEKGKSNADATD